ncbi:MAG: hypothetical protein DWQ02_11025 [Bacteroidetes bacterium]|nr:MAG: hypothetical protein DWQ02_11025 [Bacteroidota bacterium]
MVSKPATNIQNSLTLMTGISRYSILLLVLGLLVSCSPSPKEFTVTPAFYHWKSEFLPKEKEIDFLSTLSTSKLYVRYFDVALEDGIPLPVAVLESKTDFPDNYEIIPVVYITNSAMKIIPPDEVRILADRILEKVKSIHANIADGPFKQLQLDCDWSGDSKENYFLLLDSIKKALNDKNQSLSITLRLHQFKNPKKSDIPPADRAMLMFYNMGEVEDYLETNSILNLDAASKYLDTKKRYPLPMDLVLPLFQWGCIFRDQQLVHLSNNLTLSVLGDKTRFSKLSDNRYRVIKSTYLQGYFLYEGDEIRHESVSFEQLSSSVELLKEIRNTDEFSMAFYHLDSLSIEQFSPTELKQLMQQMAKGK